MPRSTESGSTDTASPAQGRFIITLPQALGERVDAAGQKMSAAASEASRISITFTRGQVVQALIETALQEADAPNGDTPDAE